MPVIHVLFEFKFRFMVMGGASSGTLPTSVDKADLFSSLLVVVAVENKEKVHIILFCSTATTTNKLIKISAFKKQLS